MKDFFLKYLLCLFVICSCTSQSNETTNESIEIPYYPFAEVSNYFAVKASLNDSEEGYFVYDSGGSYFYKVVVDSAFFYENVNTGDLEEDRPRYGMARSWWHTYYKGTVRYKVAGVEFVYEDATIEVNSRYQRRNGNNNPKIVGTLGVDVFKDRITIINFKENKIALLDTLIVDFDLNDFTSLDLQKPRDVRHFNEDHRFLSLGGFLTKTGSSKDGLFLLDTGLSGNEIIIKSSFGRDLQFERKESRKSGYNRDAEDWIWESDTLIAGNVYKVNNVEIAVSKLSPTHDYIENLVGGDGLLGLSFLKRFDIVILDYINDKLYLKTNNTEANSMLPFQSPSKQ